MSFDTKYHLVRELGRGGMAVVYEARLLAARGLERRVALKRILPTYEGSAEIREMFLDEARLVSQLSHENIVQVLDFGVLPEGEFLVMEFIDGVDAWKASRDGISRGCPIPEGLALHIVTEIAHALDYAHSACGLDDKPLGVVHRDVSPHNILLSWNGGVKLADFGIALSEKRRSSKTQTGIVKGKQRYMAPEQALGMRVASAADIYALGATLHCLLSHGPPEHTYGESLDEAGIRLDASISEEVGTLIQQCMTMKPEPRPTAEEFARKAATLGRSRRDREGRVLLQSWLRELKLAERSPGSLDDMFLGVIQVTDSQHRSFVLSRTEPDHNRKTEPQGTIPNEPSAEAVTVREAREVEANPAQAKMSPKARLLVASLMAVLGLAAWFQFGASDNQFTTTDNVPPDAGVLVRASDLDAGNLDASDLDASDLDAADLDAADLDARRAESSQPDARDAGRPLHHVSQETTSTTRQETGTAVPVNCMGYLFVAGGALRDGIIQVDGRTRYTRIGGRRMPVRVPMKLALPCGAHRIVVRDSNDTTNWLERNVVLNEQNSRTDPLRIRGN